MRSIAGRSNRPHRRKERRARVQREVNVMRSQLIRDLRNFFLTLLAIAAFLGAYWLWLIFSFDKPYHRIAREDTEARVVALLGKPYEITAPHDLVKDDYSSEEGFSIAQREVVKQYRYRVPVISGDEYIIGFDSDGRAVLKAQLTSP